MAVTRRDDDCEVLAFGYNRNEIEGRIVRIVEKQPPSFIFWDLGEDSEGVLPGVTLMTISELSCPCLEVEFDAEQRACIHVHSMLETGKVRNVGRVNGTRTGLGTPAKSTRLTVSSRNLPSL